jgi:TolB protein
MTGMDRRKVLKLGLAGYAAAGMVAPAQAQLKIIVSGGQFAPLPIAIPTFGSSDSQLGTGVAQVVMADLQRSGLFAPLDGSKFPIQAGDVSAVPEFGPWRTLVADALVMGQVERDGGQVRANVRMWDVLAGNQIFGQTYGAGADNWRRVAHIIADAIYSELSGEGGYFDSRVVYVSESGPKAKRVTRLAIMDQDGANASFLTDGTSLVLTPRYSTSSTLLSYTRYLNGNPQIFLFDPTTGQQQRLAAKGNILFSQRFSPDGTKMAFSSASQGRTNLFIAELRTGRTARLTSGAAIDTSPSFSPDGSQIAFESDRGGTQQIYIMGSNGQGPRRISFGDGRYSTPVWSPKDDQIAFTRQSGGEFQIGTMRPDGSRERILTSNFLCEGPSWSPNGRVIMFWRQDQGSAGPQLASVDVWGRSEQIIPTSTFASDPAWSPLQG